MITNRLFLVDWPDLNQYFTSPFLDWSYEIDAVESNRSYDYSNGLLFNILPNLIDGVLESHFDNIAMRANRGISGYLLDNFFERRITDQAPPPYNFNVSRLNASTHFGCLINALFQPNKEVQDYAASVVNFPLQETGNMIAINIRTGDDAFNDLSANYDKSTTLLAGTPFPHESAIFVPTLLH